MKVYFADTGYYIALLAPQDLGHDAAMAFAVDSEIAAITTDYVLLELAAYFARPPWRSNLVALVDRLREAERLTIIRDNPLLFDRAFALYRERADKAWSLVDCTSFVVMQDQGLVDALTPDHHFEQAGFRALLKQVAS